MVCHCKRKGWFVTVNGTDGLSVAGGLSLPKGNWCFVIVNGTGGLSL